jgi:YidC/Oxa1 family membrane protein insertase
MARDMAALKPHMEKLEKKYKNDKQQLQKEQLKLYQERGLNPAAGCIVALVQIPFFIALYRVILMFLNGNTTKAIENINKSVYFDALKLTKIDPWFFGYSLTTAPSHFKEVGWHYLLIPIVTAFLQYYQVKIQQAPAIVADVEKETKKENKKKDDKKDANKKGPDDFQSIMQKQMQFMFPLMIGYFSYILPVGLAIYWNIFSLFSIFQYKQSSWKSKAQSKI